MPPRKTAPYLGDGGGTATRRAAEVKKTIPKVKTLDYSITVEVKHKGTMWIKVGATAEVAEGENPTRAQKNLASWVEKIMEEKVGEMIG